MDNSQIDKVEAFAHAVVTSVKARGSVVFASEFLGSVTAMRVVANDAGVGLVPVASDR